MSALKALRTLVAPLLLATVLLSTASDASAAETTREGSRKGLMGGAAVGFGGAFMSGGFVPAPRVQATIGGGLSDRLTLAADLSFTKFLGADEGSAFGGDIDLSYFIVKGFFVHGGLGAQGLPVQRGRKTLAFGVGGNLGLGYEFWLYRHAAFNVRADYDYRYVPDDPRNVSRYGAFLMLGVRFY